MARRAHRPNRYMRGRVSRRLKPTLVPLAGSISVIQPEHARAGVLDLAPRMPEVITSGSVSLRDRGIGGEDWAAPPPWRPPASAVGTGDSNEVEPAPKRLPLAEILALLLQPPLELFVSTDGPLPWPAPLLDFQKTGIGVLMDRRSVLLADDMGLGKTIQAAAATRLLVRRGQIQRVLVVVPAAVIRNWREELRRWAPELRVVEITGTREQRVWKWDARVHVKIVSYDTLRSDSQRLLRRHGLWDLVCLDEAQRIKNSGAEVSRVAKSIVSHRRWALTGTPLENSLDDLRSILSFLQPDRSDVGPGTEDASDLKRCLARVQLRRKKSEVLDDLPPKTTTELFVPLTRQQRDEYDALLGTGVDQIRSKGAEAGVTDVLALIARLKQVCNFSTYVGRSAKLDDIAPRLATLRQEGHKALIFSQFTNEVYGVRRIARALDAFGPVIYTGDMTAEQRLRAASTFRDDPNAGVMVLSLKAGGVGLNLQAASYVFHFDRWWNPASEAQADDRSHRIGQTRGVSVYKYVCEDTIEERIHDILLTKRALFEDYVDDVSLDLGSRLTEEELFGLIGLSGQR